MAMTGTFNNNSPIINKLVPPYQNCYTGNQSWNGASFEGSKDAQFFVFE